MQPNPPSPNNPPPPYLFSLTTAAKEPIYLPPPTHTLPHLPSPLASRKKRFCSNIRRIREKTGRDDEVGESGRLGGGFLMVLVFDNFGGGRFSMGLVFDNFGGWGEGGGGWRGLVVRNGEWGIGGELRVRVRVRG